MAKNLSASVFSIPNAVTAPNIISFDGIDPTVGSGVAGPRGSIGLRTDTATVYAKVGSGDTEWQVLDNLAAALAAIAYTGSAADLIGGIIPAARMPAFIGDMTSPAGTVLTTVADDAVSDAELRGMAATAVIGRPDATPGVPRDIAASADGQVLRRAGSVLGFGAMGRLSAFGDGSDGDVTVIADTTLDRDMFYDTLVVSDNVVLNTGGFRVFARTSIELNGRIARNGIDAVNVPSWGIAGPGLPVKTLPGSAKGGDGAPNFPDVGGTPNGPVPRGYAATGGAGGVRVTDPPTPPRLGGSTGPTMPPAKGDIRLAQLAICAAAFSTSTIGVPTGWTPVGQIGAGGGGGNGGGFVGQSGGGGGGGAGYVVVCAPLIAGAGVIEAIGGKGGDGQANVQGAGTGGGGGGAGGIIVVVIASGAVPTTNVAGGKGGLKAHAGTSGCQGKPGLVLAFTLYRT